MTSKSVSLLVICFAAIVGPCITGTVASQDLSSVAERGSRYFPLSVGNSWHYILGDSKMAGKAIKWSVTQREVVHGNPVYHLWQTPAQDDEPLSISEVPGGIVEADTERFLLKNPLHVGDRWGAKSHSLRAAGKLDSSEVISAGKDCSVGGHSFNDCATVREVDEANNVTSLTTYARGVGPVKYVYFKPFHPREIESTVTIKSWQVH
jgi:hypothetical protein